MILELKDICKTYLQGKLEVPVLKNVSLSVAEGEYVAIMGPSGSGKTTLMNLIGCLDSPTSGEYLLEGQNVEGLTDRKMSDVRLKQIGFVFQSFYLLSRQTALDNVALPLLYAGVPRKERREIARKALERVGLGDRTDFKPSQLSGGQCQRVAIARAIVNDPKILLADEPTGALDTKSGEQIMEIFRSLNEEGVTILMITHEPEIAAHAKRVLYIRDGLLTAEPPARAGEPPRPAPEEKKEPAPAMEEIFSHTGDIPLPQEEPDAPQQEEDPAQARLERELFALLQGKGKEQPAPAKSRPQQAAAPQTAAAPSGKKAPAPREVIPVAVPSLTRKTPTPERTKPAPAGAKAAAKEPGRFDAPIPVALDGLGFALRKGGAHG